MRKLIKVLRAKCWQACLWAIQPIRRPMPAVHSSCQPANQSATQPVSQPKMPHVKYFIYKQQKRNAKTKKKKHEKQKQNQKGFKIHMLELFRRTVNILWMYLFDSSSGLVYLRTLTHTHRHVCSCTSSVCECNRHWRGWRFDEMRYEICSSARNLLFHWNFNKRLTWVLH